MAEGLSILADLEGMATALRDVDAVKLKGTEAVRLALRTAGEDALRIYHDHAPYKTGKFRDSISLRLEEGKETGEIVSSDSDAVARFRHGTRDHGPVTAKALRFDPGGGVIFRTWVRGVKPNPWEEPARTEAEEAVRAVMGSVHVHV